MPYFKEKLELKIAEGELEAQRIFINFSPLQKKIIILGIIAIIPMYIIVKSVTYRTNYSSYQKSRISAQPAFENPKTPAISEISITKAGDGVYAVAAKVVNENLDLSLEKAPVQFILYNENHQEVYKQPTFLTLLPGQTKYLILARINSSQKIASAEIQSLQDFSWQKRLNIPDVKLISSNPVFSNQQSPLAFVVQGTVYNNSPYQLSQIDIGFLLRDTNGKIIGISQRSEFTLKPFERRGYLQIWPGVNSSDVAKVDVLPVTDTLDDKNIALPSGGTGAADLGR